jgi:pimeloyl-ACP methyl ester carboxylesterase
MWEPQLEYLRNKNIGYIAFDFPGFGKMPFDENIHTMEGYAAYTYQILSDLNINQGTIVGLSMGGYIGLHLLKNYPSIVRALVLANSRATADAVQTPEKRLKLIGDLSKSGDLRPVIDSHLPKFITSQTRSIKPNLVDILEEMVKESTIEGIISAQEAMAQRPDYTEYLKNAHIPVLLIAADKDEFVPLTEYRHLAALIPGARLNIIDNCAHLSNLEQADKFNHILWNFLSDYKLTGYK